MKKIYNKRMVLYFIIANELKAGRKPFKKVNK